MNQSTNQFRLNIRLENKQPMKIDVIDTVTAGLDPRNDLVLVGNKINNRHLIFEKKEENLALYYLGNNNQTFLNTLPLEENKTYLLEPGDKIRFSGAEIIIEREMVTIHESQKIKPSLLNSISRITPDSTLNGITLKQLPKETTRTNIQLEPKIAEEIKVVEKKPKEPLLSLWLIKFYSLIVDAFLTYVVLVILLPLIYVDRFAISIFNYLSSLIFPNYSHSFFSFFIAWYLLSFAQTLIFGGTFGQFLLGLRNNQDNTFGRLIFYRLKTFTYSLFLLPSQNTVKTNLIYRAIRKVGMVIILIFILGSPFLLPLPYNSHLTLLGDDQVGTKDLHTRTIISYSKDLQMNLSAELPFRYYLLPSIESINKRSFELVDLVSGEILTISEVDNLNYEVIESQLKYGNPLYSTLHKSSFIQSSLEEKKMLIQSAFLVSPIHFIKNTKEFGPFFGSALLLKKSLINANPENDMILKNYNSKTPLFNLSSSKQNFYYLLGPDRMTRYLVNSVNKSNLVEVFEQAIMTKLSLVSVDSENFNKPNNQNATILEAQDAFLHGDEHTFLTYYVAIANSLTNTRIIHAESDYTEQAKLAVIKNINGFLKFIKDKSVYRSFNDIKILLAPMDKPGE